MPRISTRKLREIKVAAPGAANAVEQAKPEQLMIVTQAACDFPEFVFKDGTIDRELTIKAQKNRRPRLHVVTGRNANE